ncbi:MAG: DUF5103 domain-containing protein [Bacteroidales bacterium]|nr:DUF5103 domain-containing protein [Bacteroidales bacterium]
MKYILLSILLLFPFAVNAQAVKDSIWCRDIKTVLLNKTTALLDPPILRMGSNEQMMLRFDEFGDDIQNYRYIISHCDAQWNRDEMEPIDYMNGFEEGTIDNYDIAFNTMQMYVHYYQLIPSHYSTFTASGNYELRVVLDDNPDSTILTRRFMVYEDLVSVSANIGKTTVASGNLRCDQQVDITIAQRDKASLMLQPQYLQVIVQQNGRTDLRRTLPFTGYNSDGLTYHWREANVFHGGNCFRFFDISDLHAQLYNVQRYDSYGGETFAFLRPEEDRSRKNYLYNQSLNGGMRINVVDRRDPNIEADYVWVNFSLPMIQPRIDGHFYIVGDLTQWQLNEDSRMDYNLQYHAYTKRLHLKQGYYAYQIVFLPKGASEGETSTVEGDHYETPNTYTTMVYLRQPGDRGDRLVGIGRYSLEQ